jgi:MFS family permease
MASLPRRNRWWSLSVASIATLIVTADSGQISIALPAIIAEFNADLTLASWIALVHALITASLYLPCGRLSDLVGIGKLFLAGFILYAASSIAAGFAQGAGSLLIFRAMQAGGSALVMANNFALVTALFRRKSAAGRWESPAARYRRWVIRSVPCSAGSSLMASAGARILRFRRLAVAGFGAARSFAAGKFYRLNGEKEPFDIAGALTFALSISLLLFALMVLQKGAEQKSLVGLAALGGIVALGFFLWWEKRQNFPLLDLALFRIPALTLGNAARWISFVAMSVNNLLMPFFLQLVMGLDPLRAGFLVAPTPFAMALLAPVTGWMSERFVPERLCALGLALTGVALVFLSFLSAGATAFEVVFGLAWLGFGMGLFQTPNNN